MRFLIRALVYLTLAAIAVLVGIWAVAAYQPGPIIEVKSPEKYVGQNTPLEFFVDTPGTQPTRVDVVLEQEGQQTPLFSLDPSRSISGNVKQESANRRWVIL